MHPAQTLMQRAVREWSRREFFGASLFAGLLGALGVRAGSAATLKKRMYDDSVYTRLFGIRPHLAGHGHTTIVGGSRMPPEVLRAMAEANEQFVDMHELVIAAGKRLAEVTKAEAGLVTSGSFSALLLGAAAVLTGTDQEKIAAIPDVTWPKRECLMQKAHRISYDRAFRLAGMTIVEVETREQFAAAITERTALIAAIASLERRTDRTPGVMLPQEFIAIGRKAGVPVLVDVAAEIPPAANLTRYSEMGADLIVISGGKGLRGPQGSGLLVGRADLIEAARLNAFPYTNIGRGMKVGKEQIVGLVAAVNRFVQLDHQAIEEGWIRTAKYVAEQLQGIPGLEAAYVPGRLTPLGYDSIKLSWDEKIIPLTQAQVQERLRTGEPRIIYSGDYFITRNLEDGEEIIVARRLREFFRAEAASKEAY